MGMMQRAADRSPNARSPSESAASMEVEPSRGWPRLLSRKLAAAYLSVSTAEIDRLVAVGAIGVVRLPAVRHRNGTATSGTNRRILIDRVELDELCVKNREQTGR
jgi:hypothetical protein